VEGQPTDSSPGERFILLEPLCEDPWEALWLGRDRETGARVVIRWPGPETLAQPEVLRDLLARYRTEYVATHDLQDLRVVSAIALESTGDGQQRLVAQYVPGQTLRDRLATRGALTPEEAILLAADVAQAIAVLAHRGIVHRDIKPANIVLGEDGTARLTGFGVSQLAEDVTRTQAPTGHPGTPAFKSPEQATSTGSLDQRSDLYALGLVLTEALTARPAGRGVPLPPGVPAALAGVISRCLEPRPEDRYPTAEALLADLQHVGRESAWGQMRILWRRIRWTQSTRTVAAAALALLAVGVWRLGSAAGSARAPMTESATMTPLATIQVTAAGAAADPWEPDDIDPPALPAGASQQRAFDAQGDIDRAVLRVKAGVTYAIRTEDLAPGVDTRLEVLIDGRSITNDDAVPGMLASEVLVTAANGGVAILSVTDEGDWGSGQTYRLSAVVVPATATPLPTPTRAPSPEATPTPRPPLLTASPTPRPSATGGPVTPTASHTPLATRTPTLTRTPTRTLAPTSTRTPLASPTASNTPAPTHTPTPDRTPLPVRTAGPPSQ